MGRPPADRSHVQPALPGGLQRMPTSIRNLYEGRHASAYRMTAKRLVEP